MKHIKQSAPALPRRQRGSVIFEYTIASLALMGLFVAGLTIIVPELLSYLDNYSWAISLPF